MPEPADDASPPRLHIVVHFTAPGSMTETSRELTTADTATSVTASRSEPVRVTFAAADSSGLRRLTPAVTVQQTVGVGVERTFEPIDQVTYSCPVADLEAYYEAHTSGRRRVLIVSARAENWVGGHSIIEPLSVSME